MASGGSGALVAFGTKGIKRLAFNKAKKIANDKFVKKSALYSAFAHEYAAGSGETYGFTGDSTASLVAGAPYAAANLFGQIAIARGILGEAIGTPFEKEARSYLSTVANNTLKGAATEGITETFQTEVQLLAKLYSDPNFEYGSDEANLMRLESFVAGSVLGGGIRGGGSAITAPFSGPTREFSRGAYQANRDFQEGMDSVNQDSPPQGSPLKVAPQMAHATQSQGSSQKLTNRLLHSSKS